MGTVAMTTEKYRENRVRRLLARKGFRLNKSPSRSTYRQWFGSGYMIVDDRNCVVSGATNRPYSDSLADVEAFVAA